MTRVLCFADLHLGAGQDHRADALADQARILEQIATLAFERDVDLVLNAGDTFHRAKPAPPELHCFKRFCEALAALEIPMVAIGGNGLHEAAPGQRSALELFDGMWVQVSRTPEVVQIGGLTVCTLPAASLGRLAAARNGGERSALAEEAVDLLLASARDLFAQAPDDRPRVLLAHQMVSGASLPSGLPVEQVGSCVLPLWALEEQGWDAIVLGDIHKNQLLGETTWYCGSPMCHDFGEAAVDHGVWIFDTDEPRIADHALEFCELEDRRFITVDVDLAPEDYLARLSADVGVRLDETDFLASAIMAEGPLADAVVRVRYRASEAQHRRVDHAALQRLVMDAGAHRLFGGIAWQPVREARSRAEGLDETLGPLEALDLWLGVQDETLRAADAEGLRGLLGEWLAEAQA